MSTISGIRDTIAAWARDESGLGKVIISRRVESAQPRAPYVGIFVAKSVMSPFPLKVIDKNTNVVTVNTRAILTFEIDVFADNALEVCAKLVASLWAQERDIDGFTEFGYGSVSEIKDLSFLQTGNFRQHGQFNMPINANLVTTSPGSVLKSSEIVLEAPEKGYSEIINVDPGQPVCP